MGLNPFNLGIELHLGHLYFLNTHPNIHAAYTNIAAKL